MSKANVLEFENTHNDLKFGEEALTIIVVNTLLHYLSHILFENLFKNDYFLNTALGAETAPKWRLRLYSPITLHLNSKLIT